MLVEARSGTFDGLHVHAIQHLPCTGAIVSHQVLGNVEGEVILLRQLHGQVFIISFRELVTPSSSQQRSFQSLRRASLLLELRVAFNDLLDTILRHFPPRCPLPAGHKGDAIGGMVGDDVVTGCRALIFRIGISAQRPNSVPCGHDVSPAHTQVFGQILLALVDEVLDFILWHFVVKIRLRLDVRRANQGVALPRQEEQEGTS
mmetsp:Transcript_4811/g.11465  ORF Transcript_4811/g.11465 Transcript_4811/m.11465 type:complete len:203 (+) Transcript_4811:704-1312(+)